MPLLDSLKKRIRSVVKNFGALEWDLLHKKDVIDTPLSLLAGAVEELRLPPSKGSLGDAFLYLYEQTEAPLDQATSLLYKLQAWELALHPKKKVKWGAVALEDEMRELPETLEDFDSLVVETYQHSEERDSVSCYSIYHDKTVWSVVVGKVKLKRGGERSQPPRFFAYRPKLEPPHFLHTPPSTCDNIHLDVFSRCLGYDGYTLLDYNGFNLSGMFEALEKGQDIQPTQCLISSRAERGDVVAIRDGVTDLSRISEREEYARQVFYCDTRQNFKAICDGTLLEDDATGGEIEFFSSMEFCASGGTSLEEGMRHLISIGAVTTPVPQYMLQMAHTPANQVTFHSSTALHSSPAHLTH